MYWPRFILTSIAIAAVSASAAPANAGPAPRASASIEVCSGSLDPPEGCASLPIVSDSCINFVGGLTFFNKEVSSAEVPGGFVCSFFENFGCLSEGGETLDVVLLTGGSWNLQTAQGISGTQNFEDLTSSLSCSPV
ncbi:hypothetical protein K438DRAFT_1998140 [Mycena galopus ATCC 62051]|nr:hypothetical protein K438DRAFT_1998140 [Mycena galopus ATCC 62051]